MHRLSVDVDILRSMMRSYFSFFVFAFRPCQGSEPRMRYINT